MMRNDEWVRRAGLIAGMVALVAGPAAALQRGDPPAVPAEAEIRGALRAFYFSLAHHDWERLTAGILPAKVVAHHPAPGEIVAAFRSGACARPCSPTRAGDVEDSEILILDGWAAAAVGADEFRLIDFDGRWWIAYIDLANESDVVQLAQ